MNGRLTTGSLRLASGELRGVTLPVPRGVRPTSGRVREALLSAWQAALDGASVLDLFAGSGAVGLEALGRGAARLVGLESDRRALEGLRAAYRRWSGGRAEARHAVLPADLAKRGADGPFDRVFADPPYEFTRFAALLEGCSDLLAPGGELVIEHATRSRPPGRGGDLVLVRSRRYGESALSAYRHRSDAAGSDERPCPDGPDPEPAGERAPDD